MFYNHLTEKDRYVAILKILIFHTEKLVAIPDEIIPLSAGKSSVTARCKQILILLYTQPIATERYHTPPHYFRQDQSKLVGYVE